MPTPPQTAEPPFYILISHTPVLTNQLAPVPTTLIHPVIEYHYADDSPRSLLPQHSGEHVLVLDYDPSKGPIPTVKSLSKDLAITGVKITDAPGAGAIEDEPTRNRNMHVLETMTSPEENLEEEELQNPHAILARFMQRNATLHRALDYPDIPATNVAPEPVSAVTISPPRLP